MLPATPLLSRVEREMVALTNGELRLGQRLQPPRSRYAAIVVDTPPTFGPLMNSALNAADRLIVPVDSGYFALMGLKELLTEVEEIQRGTNPANFPIARWWQGLSENERIALIANQPRLALGYFR